MNQPRVNNSHYLVLFGIILFALALRVQYLQQPMRYDEALTYLRYASQPVQTSIASYEEPNNHVFHSVLVHLATTAFGNEPSVIRLPALIAGILLIPAVYAVTRLFYSPRAALIAAALCAVSLPLVEFSVNARGYTLLALFSTLLFGVAKLLMVRATLLRWLAFIILSALGFYTIPVMLYPFGIVAVWMILSYAREQKGWQLIKRLGGLGVASLFAGALTLLLYAPIIAQEGLAALTQNDFVTRPPTFEFYQQLFQVFGELLGFPLLGFPLLIGLTLFGGVLLALFLHRRIGGAGISVGWAALLWLAPVLLFQRVIPFDRTWTAITPLYLMLAAAGIGYLVARSDGVFAAALVLLVAPSGFGLVQSSEVTGSDRTGRAPDAEAAALWLHETAQTDDVILIPTPFDVPVRYYLDYYGYSDSGIRNQYQAYWIDLMQETVGHVYVFGAAEDNVDALIHTLALPAPSFPVRLETVETFSEMAIQELVLPAYPEGLLYADDFEGSQLFPGWALNNVEAELVKMEGNEQALLLTSDADWGEMNLSGALDWRDYAVELRVQVVVPGTDAEDIYVHLRSTAAVGSYIAGYDVEEARAFIGGDENRQWRGFLALTPMQFAAGRWYRLRFAAQGDEITLAVDGEQVTAVEDTVAQAGAVRILIPPNSQVLLDDLRITRLDEG